MKDASWSTAAPHPSVPTKLRQYFRGISLPLPFPPHPCLAARMFAAVTQTPRDTFLFPGGKCPRLGQRRRLGRRRVVVAAAVVAFSAECLTMDISGWSTARTRYVHTDFRIVLYDILLGSFLPSCTRASARIEGCDKILKVKC